MALTKISHDDNDKAVFRTSEDLQIFHNGSHSLITNTTGNLQIGSGSVDLLNAAQNEYTGRFTEDGAVELYYDGVKKFETKSDGVDIIGELQCDSLDVDGAAEFTGADVTFYGASTNSYWDQSTNRFTFEDNTMAAFGSGQDLAIYHDGSNSYLGNATGDIIIENSGGNTSNQIYIRGKTGVDSIRADGNGGTYIYDQGSGSAILKISTNNTFGTILSNTTDDANETNVLTLARRGYEASGYGVNFKVKGGSSSGQNGLVMQVSQGSGGYSDKFRFDNDGLKFGSDTAAANGLSDYETGTWTPAANIGPTAYGSGNYTKVGKMVFASFEISFGSTSSTSHQSITGLPFNCASSQHGGVADGYTNNSNNPIIYHISTGENKIYMYYGSGSNLNANNVTGDNFRGVAVYAA